MDRASRLTFLGLAAAVATALVVFGRSASSHADVVAPLDPATVVTTLPFAANDSRRREIAELRRVLAKDARDLRAAVALARLDVVLSRERADPRYLGHAEAALAPWWSAADAPPEVLVLRATIEQSLHDFDAALATLDRTVAIAPGDVQAWLTKATVLTVRARYAEARDACATVEGLGAPLAALVCTAQIDSLTGHARDAHDRLSAASARASGAERQWAVSVLGEMALRAGDPAAAEAHFRMALDMDAKDAYSRGAYADLLLDAGRFAEAISLSSDQESNDGLLLRLAIAEKRSGAEDAAAHAAALGARFDASRARGDVVHRREEARYWLELAGDPSRALALAKANFDVQKEPWDVRVLLEAAAAARAPGEAQAAIAHVERTSLEDPAVAQALGRLR